jgi:hypothetical protein
MNPVLDADSDDSLPYVGVLVVVDCKYAIIATVTWHMTVRACVGLHQWRPILFNGETHGEVFHKERDTMDDKP